MLIYRAHYAHKLTPLMGCVSHLCHEHTNSSAILRMSIFATTNVDRVSWNDQLKSVSKWQIFCHPCLAPDRECITVYKSF